MRRRKDARSRRSVTESIPLFTGDSPIGPEAEPTGSLVQSEQIRLRVRAAAKAAELEGRGNYESLDITGFLENPTVASNLVEYTVAAGQVVKITKIGVTYSNPLFAMSTSVGWRVTVNGGRAPNIRPSSGDLFYTSMGDISRPMDIEPFCVQTGQIVAIEVVPESGFNERLTMIARLAGQIIALTSTHVRL